MNSLARYFPRRLDADLLGRVQPITIARYRAVAAVFTERCKQEGFAPVAAEIGTLRSWNLKVSRSLRCAPSGSEWPQGPKSKGHSIAANFRTRGLANMAYRTQSIWLRYMSASTLALGVIPRGPSRQTLVPVVTSNGAERLGMCGRAVLPA